MTDGDALLRAVIASPGDDLCRLVLADWLDENGRPDRAEFIRAGCAMARYTDCPDRLRDVAKGRPRPLRCGACEYCAARRACERLANPALEGELGAVLPAWSWSLDPGLDLRSADGRPAPGVHLTLARGFAESMACPLAEFLRHAPALFARQPIAAVTLTDKRPIDGHGWSRNTPTNRPRRGPLTTRRLALDDAESCGIPDDIFAHMPGGSGDTVWREFDAPLTALSVASVAWGRAAAGAAGPA